VVRFADDPANRLRLGQHAINPNWFGDVLDLVLAKILVAKIELLLDLVEYRSCESDATRLGKRLQTRRNIHAIAKQVIALDDYVAKIDTDAQSHAAIFRQIGVVSFKFALDIDRTAHGFDRARELGDNAVASAAEHPAMMPGDLTVYDLPVGAQGANGGFLVSLHELTVADHVSGQYHGQAAFHMRSPPRRETSELRCENLCGERFPQSRLWVVGSTDERNTLIFGKRWSVEHEVSSSEGRWRQGGVASAYVLSNPESAHLPP